MGHESRHGYVREHGAVRGRRTVLGALVVGAALVALGSGPAAQQPPAGQGQAQGQGQRGGGRQGQARDRAAVPQGTASIAGRVLTADTGRPVKRARVVVSGGGRGGRSTATDDQGRYAVTGLPAGNYTITASRAGFVDAIFGQRRPLQPGAPMPVADGAAVANVDLRLMRGGVITGRVLDEDGEALARALVTVQRYQYVRGERQLTPAGGDQTDDRGQYRVFGLPPGEYYVSASTAGLGELLGRGLQQLAAGLGGRGGRGALAAFGSNEGVTSGYAPTYYPGVASAAQAGQVAVAPGQELGGIDFQIQLVPLATVSGIVAGADGSASVVLVPHDATAVGRFRGQSLNGRTQADGTFMIANVPPGQYVAVARTGGGRSSQPKMGTQSIVVNGQNVEGVALVLQSGVSLSGNITVESSGTPAPTDYSSFRIEAPEVDPLPVGGGGRGGTSRAENNGAFRVDNLLPGLHYIRLSGGGQGQWTLKSVTAGGQDVTDMPIEIKPGVNVDNVTVVLTDRATELSGTVRDTKGVPMAAVTVIVFSTDQQYWRPQSRRIQAARTSQSGVYRIRALPPGDYLLVVTDDAEQGEWFDPAFLEEVRGGAKRVSLTEGETRTEDLRGPGA
jgi:hypothetical protein